MEKTNQAVEGQMVLRRNDHAGRMEALKEMLAMQFSWMKHHEGAMVQGLAEGIEKPCRATFTSRDIFGRYPTLNVHLHPPCYWKCIRHFLKVIVNEVLVD